MLYYKLYNRKHGFMIAVCDKSLLGKTLRSSETKIEFFVNPRFYQGEQATKKEIISLLRKAVNINLIGKEAVQAGIEAGLVNQENIVFIDNIPHAQVIIMTD